MFELARDLHVPVARLSDEMEHAEFQQWKALYTVEAEERAAGWSRQEELLAVLVEVTQEWLRALTLLTGGQKLKSLPGKVRLKRPTDPQVDSQSDAQRAMALFAQLGKGGR